MNTDDSGRRSSQGAININVKRFWASKVTSFANHTYEHFVFFSGSFVEENLSEKLANSCLRHTHTQTFMNKTVLCKQWENIYTLDLTYALTKHRPSVQIKQISLDVSSPFRNPPRDVELRGTHFKTETPVT